MHSTRPTVTRWKTITFLARHVPSVLFAGIKVHSISLTQCSIALTRNRRNRNPNNSVYFSNVVAAGEMAAGMMLFDDILNANNSSYRLAAAITHAGADFRKPVDGKGALVVCRQGLEIAEAVQKARKTRMARITTESYVLDPNNINGDPLATVYIEWAIVRHRRTA